jgi:hypothetical protein
VWAITENRNSESSPDIALSLLIYRNNESNHAENSKIEIERNCEKTESFPPSLQVALNAGFCGFYGKKPINKRVFGNPCMTNAPFTSPKARSKKLKKKKVRSNIVRT